MSFFRSLFGRKTAADFEAEADAALAAGDFGGAKLLFDRALERADADARPRLEASVAKARDGIGRERLVEARRLIALGEPELARIEIDGGIEVASDDALRAELRSLFEELDRVGVVEAATEATMSDEDRRAIIAGQWSDAQAEEFAPYEDALLDALIAMADGETQKAREAIDALLALAEAPCFLYREVAIVRGAEGDREGATDALERYLARLPASAPDELRLEVHLRLAAVAADAGDVTAAIEHLWAGVEVAPDDIRAYKSLGATLRQAGSHADAAEILTTALPLLGNRPDWQLYQELGLAHEGAGHTADARRYLDMVVNFFRDQRSHDIPPETGRALARMHENDGRLDRAADLYRLLAGGSDRANHGLYYREAGRLLTALGLSAEAETMLRKADALGARPEEAERV